MEIVKGLRSTSATDVSGGPPDPCVYFTTDATSRESEVELPKWREGHRGGTNAVKANGVTANFISFDRGTSGYSPFTYFYLTQKCQGIPFSPACQQAVPLQRPH